MAAGCSEASQDQVKHLGLTVVGGSLCKQQEVEHFLDTQSRNLIGQNTHRYGYRKLDQDVFIGRVLFRRSG
jgi:hypothetical protein